MSIMATHGGSRGDRLGNSNHQKSSIASPEKVRELLNDGVSSTDIGANRCIFLNDLALSVWFKGAEEQVDIS